MPGALRLSTGRKRNANADNQIDHRIYRLHIFLPSLRCIGRTTTAEEKLTCIQTPIGKFQTRKK
ncbi:hypothetical protein TGAM01_v202254 [Trichoderma gamsii]|uniref:Uncharacterized protein n=1 Tax=Trichoderma gamsii TaxID=398673 RepID=A0A2P4ZXY2_9HYPO|nr:hypothetical protein TGAM01_v202254 [Trichoderma gamsii]PON29146.1 hypothetical protein TGAM01_v202254 [Trichoderma gamsii]